MATATTAASTSSPESDIKLAAILIKDAVDGRDFKFREDAKSLWWYEFYNNNLTTFLNGTAVFFLLLLALFEKPVSCDFCHMSLPVSPGFLFASNLPH